MVSDKANGTIKDLAISPTKSSTLAISYYVATIISTLTICIIATIICLVYLYAVGFFMSALDVLLLFIDVILLVLFGTALSSIINIFLSSQGQISAVGTIVSSGYGFICGAYMPISSFGEGLQKIISFLPGTYATALIRNHSMRGALLELENEGITSDAVNSLKDAMDCNIYFFEHKVDISTMYIILGASTAILLGIYILINVLKKKSK
jgi:multidrug/hemolysin transport system permease protein